MCQPENIEVRFIAFHSTPTNIPTPSAQLLLILRLTQMMLSLLLEHELWTRLPTIQLLTTLLLKEPALVEKAILTSREGMLRLVDVLEDRREEVMIVM